MYILYYYNGIMHVIASMMSYTFFFPNLLKPYSELDSRLGTKGDGVPLLVFPKF